MNCTAKNTRTRQKQMAVAGVEIGYIRAEILAGLLDPGRRLVFIDDGGTPAKPLPDLARDFRVLCGVVVRSENYPNVTTRIPTELNRLPAEIREFHTNEVVNPGTRSAWSTISIDRRLALLWLVHALLVEYVDEILYCFVSGEQFETELRPRLLEAGLAFKDYKSALRHAFFNALVKCVEKTPGEVAIIEDASEELSGSIKVQQFVSTYGFYQGGVIIVDSSMVEGLQLADLAAWLFNRLHHVFTPRKASRPTFALNSGLCT